MQLFSDFTGFCLPTWNKETTTAEALKWNLKKGCDKGDSSQNCQVTNQQQIFLSSYCIITPNIMVALRPIYHNNNKSTQKVHCLFGKI